MGRRSSSGERDVGASPECCMCGDCGLSSEIFSCHLCRFRFQHKYCSNMYPKAEIYDLCNWCLVKKRGGQCLGNTKLAPPCRNKSITYYDDVNKRKRVVLGDDDDHSRHRHNHGGGIKKSNRDDDQVMIDADRSGAGRRKKKRAVVTSTDDHDHGGKRINVVTLLMSSQRQDHQRSDDGGAMVTKQQKVFRNKVIRRYKLLDEVST